MSKLSNSQLNKLKSGVTNGTALNLNLSSNVFGNFNYETNFPNKLLLTNTQNSRFRKAFANGSSGNTKFSQLSKIGNSERFLGKLLGPSHWNI